MTGIFEAGTPPARIPAVAALLAVEGRITRLAGRLTRLEPVDMTAAPATAMFDDPLRGLDAVLPHRAGGRGGQTHGEETGEEATGEVTGTMLDRPARTPPRPQGTQWAAPGFGRETLERPATGAFDISGWPGPRVRTGECSADTLEGPAHPGVPAADRVEYPAGTAAPAAPARPTDPDADTDAEPRAGNGRLADAGPNPASAPTGPRSEKPVTGRGSSDLRPTGPAVQDGADRVNGAAVTRKGGLRVGTDPLAALAVLRANVTGVGAGDGTPPQPGVTRGDAGPGPDTAHPVQPAAPVASAGANADQPHDEATTSPADTREPGNQLHAPHPSAEPSEELVETLLDAMTDRLRLDLLRSYGSAED
ncbi:hypothetical protein [Actinopolymorpha pittospori]